MPNSSTANAHCYEFQIPATSRDRNGHVNNVCFVDWMQDAAIRHLEALDLVRPIEALGATWVVRTHDIRYLSPAFPGEILRIRTWVESLHRLRSLRGYEFIRKHDGKILVRGLTDWAFVDLASGRPLRIPRIIAIALSPFADQTG